MAQQINITLYQSELLYDVRIKLSKIAETFIAKKDFEQASNIQDTDGEDENVLLRSIDNAFSSIVNTLAKYIDVKNSYYRDGGKGNDTISNSSNNALNTSVDDASKNKVYQYQLSMPSNYNETTKTAITAASHSYIVNLTIFDWLEHTDRGDAKDYMELAKNDMDTLISAVFKRNKPTYNKPKGV